MATMKHSQKHQCFVFESYDWNPGSRELKLRYALDDSIRFEERWIFPDAPFHDVDSALLNRAFFNLHLAAGVSYYKAFCPPNIEIQSGVLSQEEATFWDKLFTQGLGEFFYQNKIDFRGLIQFPFEKTAEPKSWASPLPERSLLPLGGGKDSIVAAELLKHHKKEFQLVNVGGHAVAQNVAASMQKSLWVVKRNLDTKLFELNAQGALNGHVPITSIVTFSQVIMALLYGFDSVVFANENSANEGNTHLHGMEINHQYSKSFEFEQDLSRHVQTALTPDLKVFSLLRPFSELKIAEMFSRFPQYFEVFSSCNRNFGLQKKALQVWCGECPKCAFVFAVLSPFVERESLLKIFGKDLLADPLLEPLFRELLGQENFKPFECVGTPEEVEEALHLAEGKAPNHLELFAPQPEHSLPKRFLEMVGNQRVLILGYGKEGQSALKFLQQKHPFWTFAVADKNPDLKVPGVLLHTGENYLSALKFYDLIIKSPGIPWFAELLAVKEKLSSGTELFFEHLDPSNTVIGVTGSKGKSTTTRLLYEVLKAADKPVELVGNIGEPMLDHVHTTGKIFVCELSSYQLDGLKHSPHLAIFTAFFPDHLDVHGSLSAYFEAKSNVTRHQSPDDLFFFHKKYPELAQLPGQGDHIAIQENAEDTAILDALHLPGLHNRENATLVLAAARALSVSDEITRTVFANFKGLPHRLEDVGTFKGIRFIDDANATTPDGTLAALKTFEGQVGTLFLGGQDRGYDFGPLIAEILRQKIDTVIVFPQSGLTMKALLESADSSHKPLILDTTDLRQAVSWAYEHTPQGKIALLSMASPSYGLFKNFEEKGRLFQEYVNEISTPTQS
jgi:UDP-N-acetylmuramoylalanine--D-glutamate ligase